MTQAEIANQEPSLWKWVLKVAGVAGISGILCCVAPMVLFMFGLAGGVWAISFADFFYEGTGNVGVWVLRGLAVAVGVAGIVIYRRKQDQCSIEPGRKRKNLILAAVAVTILGGGLLISLEKLSTWYFDKYIVPAQQEELRGER